MKAVRFLKALINLPVLVASSGGSSTSGSSPTLRPHGTDFVADHILRVSLDSSYSIACATRPTVLVNGSSPGPTIHLEPGKASWVRVYNDLSNQNLTMHWHGLSQRTAIFSDGTPSASQWPIPPLHYFDYQIRPASDDAGTYFYHSHVGFQSVSAHGALIVDDAQSPPYSYDEERIVLLADYFNDTDLEVQSQLTSDPFQWPGETNAVLLNGIGVSNNVDFEANKCVLPVIYVNPGLTYRLRFIGGTALSMTQFAITEHDQLSIIAADGQYTQPYEVDYMQIAPGQRFDVIFHAKAASDLHNSSDFLIQFETKDRPAVYTGYAILRYDDEHDTVTSPPSSPPITFPLQTYDWAEYALQPLLPNNFPTAAEVTRRITIDARQRLEGSIIWQFNGDQWNETTPATVYPGGVPYLVEIYDNGPSAVPNYTAALANEGWDPATFAFPAQIGEVLEIIWQNTGSLVDDGGGLDYHPMHAHGRHFYDIGSGSGTYDPVANEERLATSSPVERDTTLLYRYADETAAGNASGWRGWRLRVEDAGVWMMHCHILQHMLMGMQTVWVFGNYSEIVRVEPDIAAGYLQYGGSAYGSPDSVPQYVDMLDYD